LLLLLLLLTNLCGALDPLVVVNQNLNLLNLGGLFHNLQNKLLNLIDGSPQRLKKEERKRMSLFVCRC